MLSHVAKSNDKIIFWCQTKQSNYIKDLNLLLHMIQINKVLHQMRLAIDYSQ